MASSRRPAAGRRPAASRGRVAGPARPGAVRPRTGAPAPPAVAVRERRTGLTHRAAVLLLVVTTLVLSAALPLRELLDQRSAIADLEQRSAAGRERVAALQQDRRRLDDPAFIAAEARRRLHMARPGEVGYLLLTPEPVPEPDPAPTGVGADAPWWSQVWGSVQDADRPPAPAPSPAAVPAPAPTP